MYKGWPQILCWVFSLRLFSDLMKFTAVNENLSKQSAKFCSRIRQKPSIGFVVIPYTQGIAESFKMICCKYGIQTYFKGNTTIKQLLMKPKDQDPKDKRSGVIYSYQDRNIVCGEEYIVETSRTLGERYRKHLKELFPIHVHIQQTGHNSTSKNSMSLGGRTRAWPGPSMKPSTLG